MIEGILLVDKPKGKTSFSLVGALRKRLDVQKIGHAGTLDPFATGLMVMLIGKKFTKKSDQFLTQDKEYLAEVHLGIATDSYDTEGKVTLTSEVQPDLKEVEEALINFQGEIEQIPPMFSAKKINGKKLYDLARQGKSVERSPVKVSVRIDLLSYSFPKLCIRVNCSKGTYVRSLAHDIGISLGCYGYLTSLQRIRCGHFHLKDCFPGDLFQSDQESLKKHFVF